MRSTAWMPPALLMAASLVPHAAHAQLDPRITAARRGLIEDAQRARASGDHVRALELSQRALAMQPTGSLRRFIAEELLATRHYSDALGMAEQCEHDLRTEPQARARDENLASCVNVRREAAAHTGRVVLRFTPQPPTDARVVVNEAPFPSTLWGVPAIVDEGSASIAFSHAGFRSASRTVPVSAGAIVEVTIELEAIEAPRTIEPNPAPNPAPDRVENPHTISNPVAPPRAPQPPRMVSELSLLVPVGAAVAGVGAIASGSLYGAAWAVAGGFDAACFPNGVAAPGAACGARMQADQATIDGLQAGSIVGLGVVGVGATLAIIGLARPSQRTVTISAHSRGVIVGGTF